jgi:hypothetical protein
MNERADVVFKDHTTTRDNAAAPRQPGAEPERVFGALYERGVIVGPARRGPPAGSVDLLSLHYDGDDLENWGRAVRLQDVVSSIECGLTILGQAVREGREADYKLIDTEIDKVEAKIAAVQLENLELRSLLSEIRGELADAVHAVERLKAARGVAPAAQGQA